MGKVFLYLSKTCFVPQYEPARWHWRGLLWYGWFGCHSQRCRIGEQAHGCHHQSTRTEKWRESIILTEVLYYLDLTQNEIQYLNVEKISSINKFLVRMHHWLLKWPLTTLFKLHGLWEILVEHNWIWLNIAFHLYLRLEFLKPVAVLVDRVEHVAKASGATS